MGITEVSSEISLSIDDYITQILDAFIRLIISSPYYLIPFVSSYISGHVWSYIILSYFSKKERKILCSFQGRLSLGVVWSAFVFLITHLVMYLSLNVNLESYKNVIFLSTLVSLAAQGIILAVITFVYRKEN